MLDKEDSHVAILADLLDQAADESVVEHGQRLEEGDVLECAPDPEFRNPVRWAVEDRAAFKVDVAAGRRIKPAQAIEQSRFAGAVRSDETEDLPAVHLEGNA